MKECKPIGTPFSENLRLLKLSDEEFGNVQRKMEGVPYKAGVGSLIYAMLVMKADIAFVVSIVSQFMLKAAPPHLDGCKTHYEVFEEHFRLQIMPWMQVYCLERLCVAD